MWWGLAWLCLADEPMASAPAEVEDEASELLDIAAEIVAGRAAPPPPVPMPETVHPPRDNRILPLGEGAWSIAASLRDHYAPRIDALKELARPTAHRSPAGDIVGWRLRIERYGLLHQAGFRNGDVVRAVNGRALDSWTAVLAAWNDLKRADRLQVELTRHDGRRLVFTYRIR